MPMYDYKCPRCGVLQPVFKKIRDLGETEYCEAGNCEWVPMQRQISAPMVATDLAGYSCPITGVWIEGRRAHEENLKRHGRRVLEPGETSSFVAEREREDRDFEALIDRSVESQIHAMPARKRERLAAELEGGLDASVTRTTPPL